MNLIGTKLNSLNRRLKTILVLFNDLFLAFTCWLVFGPPMATIISNQNTNNLIALKINGDSMIDAGLYNQDLVVIDKSIKPIDGEIGAFLIHNTEATVKYINTISNNNRGILLHGGENIIHNNKAANLKSNMTKHIASL